MDDTAIQIPDYLERSISKAEWDRQTSDNQEFLASYKDQRSITIKPAEAELRKYLDHLLNLHEIQHFSIEVRSKEPISYVRKALKPNDDNDPDGPRKYQNPHQNIEDALAARVLFYTEKALEAFLGVLTTECQIVDRDIKRHNKKNGYSSIHVIIRQVDTSNKNPAGSKLLYLKEFLREFPAFEIQLRTVATHAWAEYEHDLRYKRDQKRGAAWDLLTAQDKKRFERLFLIAADLRKSMDRTFTTIQEIVDEAADKQNRTIGDSAPSTGNEQIDTQFVRDFIANDFQSILPQTASLRPPNVEQLDSITSYLRSSRTDTIKEDDLAQLSARLTAKRDGRADDWNIKRLIRLIDTEQPDQAQCFNDALLLAFGEDYAEAPDSDYQKMLMTLRLNWIDFRYRVYAVTTPKRQHSYLTSQQAMQRVAIEYANILGKPFSLDVHNETVIGVTPNDLGRFSHADVISTDDGNYVLYVNATLNREYTEKTLQELWRKAGDAFKGYRVYRGGAVFLGSEDPRCMLMPTIRD